MKSVSNPTFGELVGTSARIGLISFGGPAGQIALMHKMLVEERKWVSEPQFLHALNFCMLLPGPEAQQLAIYIGWLKHGVWGGIVAGTLFVLPGFCVILALSTSYALFQETQWLAGIFFGLKAAVLALVLEAMLRISRRALKNWFFYALAVLAFLAVYALKVPFPVIIVIAGVIGYFGSQFLPQLLNASASGQSPGITSTSGGWRYAGKVVGICCALWTTPILALGLIAGWDSSYIAIASFFSKMAVVTFGGAYAVLAYVAQEAVETLGWLKPGEMLDGLALAETTPGPLILVLSYVGFLAGFRHPGFVSPLVGGVIGASLTAWVTFVPCFLWIFLGAPHMERLRSNLALSGALAAITASIVGVIFNLTIFLALNSLFHTISTIQAGPLLFAVPLVESLDAWALGLTLFAMFILFRLKVGPFATLLACAALGFAVKGGF